MSITRVEVKRLGIGIGTCLVVWFRSYFVTRKNSAGRGKSAKERYHWYGGDWKG